MHLGGLRPDAVLPGELLAYPAPHPPVIGKLRFPRVRHGHTAQLVLVVIIKASRAVAGQIPVRIVDIAHAGRQVDRHRIRVRTVVAALRDGRIAVVAVQHRLTNMMDAVGTTVYSYANQFLASEDGPWANDTVSYIYTNRLRGGLTLLQPNA